jgi:hypothetical protein
VFFFSSFGFSSVLSDLLSEVFVVDANISFTTSSKLSSIFFLAFALASMYLNFQLSANFWPFFEASLNFRSSGKSDLFPTNTRHIVSPSLLLSICFLFLGFVLT